MNNDKLFWSAIKNNYAKTVDSSGDLKKTITQAVQKAKEENSPLKLIIVHPTTKTKIEVSRRADGSFSTSII